VNGNFLGEHRGGFGAFGFEITRHLSAGGTNVIAVRVSNSWEPDVAPLSGDFSVYGGIYRPVHLIETAAENFTLTDHGSPGVAWLQTSVTKKKAVLDMTAQISNGTADRQPLTLVATVLDANGKKIAESKQPVVLAPNVTAPYWLRVTVPRPHLWNGRPDPYLYRAVVELRSTNGVVDSVGQPLGLRFYRVDPDQGFFLNGKPYPCTAWTCIRTGGTRGGRFPTRTWTRTCGSSRKSAPRLSAARITSTAIIFTAGATRRAFSSGRKSRRSMKSMRRSDSPKPRAASCSISSGKTSIIPRFLPGVCSTKSDS